MHQSERSRKDVLAQTWARTRDVCPTFSGAGPVSTLRVKIVGAATAADSASATADFSKTKRYSSILPSFDDCIPQTQPVYDERDWRVISRRDVSYLLQNEHHEQALALAATLPAISPEDLGLEASGVHELDRLRLTLDPRDSVPGHEPAPHASGLTPTLRVKPCAEAPVKRAWRLWEAQSPFIAIGTAATFCVLSALLVNLLAP